MTETMEIPRDEPILRTSENRLVASARYLASMVEKAMVDSGTKTKPSPRPCNTPVQITGPDPICGEKSVMKYKDAAVRISPKITSNRLSTARTSLPTKIIETIVPIPRGPITRPVVMVG